MKEDFIAFSEKIEKIKSLDIISFKKLYSKKLSIFLSTDSEIVSEDLVKMKLSFDRLFLR
ncbi:hypothetical protein [Paenimyroides baculatum]|uniref:Uncharacterized protein n=1 Tax=Paenimyroides baculatum TaxID=2608000 RepID=A0A5M6CJK5_9FLAO|nr:hypothetical protein [Paenimyroides baculatum]KAA5535398.1 hypothetical protein F0460_08770 [Paenimyroides baculatum]